MSAGGNILKKETLLKEIAEAKLMLSVTKDMTTLRNKKDEPGMLGFAIFKDNRILSWKRLSADEYEVASNKLSDDELKAYLHLSFDSRLITLKQYLEDEGSS